MDDALEVFLKERSKLEKPTAEQKSKARLRAYARATESTRHWPLLLQSIGGAFVTNARAKKFYKEELAKLTGES